METPFAVAGPLPLLSELAVTAPPVTVPMVLLFAVDPELDTLPDPVADNGAFTVVFPTVALLVWLLPAAMFTAPPPAVALLLVDGVTVWVLLPVVASLPPPSEPLLAEVLAAAPPREPHELPLLPMVPEFAAVHVGPPLAVLLADGESVMLVLPPEFELEAYGSTVMVLPVTVPDPLEEALLIDVASPPSVLFDTLEVAVDVDGPFPLPVAVAVDAPPVAAPVVAVVADAPAKAGAATNMTTNPAVMSPNTADARDVRRMRFRVELSPGLILTPPY